MKCAYIRDKNGKKLTEKRLERFCRALQNKLKKTGFLCEVYTLGKSAITLSARSKSFVIDVKKLGYNARFAPWFKTIVGWKNTETPTWAQRVQFNNIVNDHFDAHQISARIRSGAFKIRDGFIRYTEYDWFCQKPRWIAEKENRGWYVDALTPDMIAEAKEKRRKHNRIMSKKRREEKKALKLIKA